jgi:hypothetical protein
VPISDVVRLPRVANDALAGVRARDVGELALGGGSSAIEMGPRKAALRPTKIEPRRPSGSTGHLGKMARGLVRFQTQVSLQGPIKIKVLWQTARKLILRAVCPHCMHQRAKCRNQALLADYYRAWNRNAGTAIAKLGL